MMDAAGNCAYPLSSQIPSGATSASSFVSREILSFLAAGVLLPAAFTAEVVCVASRHQVVMQLIAYAWKPPQEKN